LPAGQLPEAEEAGSDWVLSWLTQHVSMDLTISDWVIAEFASALSVKMRMGQLSAGDRAKAASVFTRLEAESLVVVPATWDHFVSAAQFGNRSKSGLRADDALHVAVAAGLGATIRTVDKRPATEAVALGVSAENDADSYGIAPCFCADACDYFPNASKCSGALAIGDNFSK